MIEKLTIKHVKESYWTVHVDELIDPDTAEREVVAALADDDYILAREWMPYTNVRKAGYMPATSTSDYFLDRCLLGKQIAALRRRGLWRKANDLAPGKTMTVHICTY